MRKTMKQENHHKRKRYNVKYSLCGEDCVLWIQTRMIRFVSIPVSVPRVLELVFANVCERDS